MATGSRNVYEQYEEKNTYTTCMELGVYMVVSCRGCCMLQNRLSWDGTPVAWHCYSLKRDRDELMQHSEEEYGNMAFIMNLCVLD